MTLPLRFLLTGVLAWAAGVVLLMVRPDVLAGYHYNQYVVAVTHLFVLGFVSSIVMGALYQLSPVALETRLYSERLVRWHFPVHVVGFVGMVWMFWVWDMKQVGHFGSLLALGVGWLVYNLCRTLARAPRRDVLFAGLSSVLFWFSFVILAGLYLACAKCWNFSPFDAMAAMHAHAHAGVLGVFIMLIVAVSFKLLPMFALSDLQSPRRAAWSLGLLNAGLAGAFVTILLQSAAKFAFGLVLVAGLILYGVEMRAILRARKRRALDWGLIYFLAGVWLLAPVSVAGLILAWPTLPLTGLTGQLENTYGLLAVLGVVGLAILGMLYKILPFLVWYRVYSRQVGQARVPTLAQMHSNRLQAAGFWLYLAGLAVVSTFTLLAHEEGIRWGAVLLAASLGLFLTNVGVILSHTVRPRLDPFPIATTALPQASS